MSKPAPTTPVTSPAPTTPVQAKAERTFAELGLPAPLAAALTARGMVAPFPIQAASIPDALAGRDVLGRAQTGSGKTLAFGLPMLARLAGGTTTPKRPRGLVLVPTRELAQQVSDSLQPFADILGLKLHVMVGGTSMNRQVEALRRGVDLLVATPGRLADHLQQGTADLGQVQVVALDEADHMADMGFLPQVKRLMDKTPPKGQRLLFSATLDGDVDVLIKRYLTNPVTHSTAPVASQVSTMEHHLLVVTDADKKAVVAHVANREGRTIMFVRTKHGVDRLAKQIRATGTAAGALHGGKAQNNRTRTLDAFKSGSTPVLVATDVAARGIHVDDVSLVVHVDPPADHKDYLHRAGRTARAGDDGVVVTLVTPEQRREVETMTRKAGVKARTTPVRAGDDALVAITGSRVPTGAPIAEPPAQVQGAPRRPAAGRAGGGQRSGGAQGGRGGAGGGRAAASAGGRGRSGGGAGGSRSGRSSGGAGSRSGSIVTWSSGGPNR